MKPLCLMIPGIVGSTLKRRGRPEDPFTLKGKIGLAQIKNIHITRYSDGVEQLDDWEAGSAVEFCYGDFVRAVSNYTNYHCEAWAYDWRYSINRIADKLVQRIERENINRTISLVGHSMGGRVIAAATHKLSSQRLNSIERIITCGTPWEGAYSSCAALVGADFWAPVLSLANLWLQTHSVSRGSIADQVKRRVKRNVSFFVNYAESRGYLTETSSIQDALRTYQSVYELLPTNWLVLQLYGTLSPGMSTFDPNNYDDDMGNYAQLFAAAAAQDENKRYPKAGEFWVNLFNLDLPCMGLRDYRQRFRGGIKSGNFAEQSVIRGDGTVPMLSAQGRRQPSAVVRVRGVEHMKMMAHHRVIGEVISELRGDNEQVV